MDCLHPVVVRKLVQDLSYVNADTFVIPSASVPLRNHDMVGKRCHYVNVSVPCGKCEACQANLRQQWAGRLYYEWMHASTAAFVTLTYRDADLHYTDNQQYASVCKRDVQLFFKRLRKRLGKGIRYMLISEYGDTPGSTLRPHYHMLLFNYPPMDNLLLTQVINEAWQHSDLWQKVVEPVNGNRIGYVAGYVSTRKVHPQGTEPNFMLCSRRPGIGAGLLTPAKLDYFRSVGKLSVCTPTGTYPLHRYYRDRIVDDEFRVKFAQQYDEYKQARNIEKYGVPFDLTRVTKEYALSHGASADSWHNANEALNSWIRAFRKKQLHKHIKL